MNIRRIHFLCEVWVSDTNGQDAITFEFTYDNGGGRAPHFFGVAGEDLPQARALYAAWGGRRLEGDRFGKIMEGPPSPFIQSQIIRKT